MAPERFGGHSCIGGVSRLFGPFGEAVPGCFQPPRQLMYVDLGERVYIHHDRPGRQSLRRHAHGKRVAVEPAIRGRVWNLAGSSPFGETDMHGKHLAISPTGAVG